MRRALLYYSRNGFNYINCEIKNIEIGNTEKIAKLIKESISCIIYKIEMVKPYSKNYEECLKEAEYDYKNNIDVKLKDYYNLSFYDEIFIGYPIFFSSLPMPIYSYLVHSNLENKIIYPFITHEGSGIGDSIYKLRTLLKNCEIKDPFIIPGSLVDNCKLDLEKYLLKNNIK